MTDILGPEGYCRTCRFIVSLDDNGKLGVHKRGALLRNSEDCPGSGGNPPKVTPYASKKSKFKVIAPLAVCHVCKSNVVLLSDGRLNGHPMGGYRAVSSPPCNGAYTQARTLPDRNLRDRG